MRFDRYIATEFLQYIQKGKVSIIYGPRQVGKTTFLNTIVPQLQGNIRQVEGDQRIAQELFSSQRLEILRQAIGNADILVIDEAQRIENIGINLKIIVDELHIPVIATGSSTFELANKVRESLAGRTWTFRLYPMAYLELQKHFDYLSLSDMLETLLIYGSYPQVITEQSFDNKRRYISEVVEANLYKDILELQNVKNPKKIRDLLSLLAFQIGSEVSLTELASNLELNRDTVERYLDLCEKAFIIINIRGFSRNLRKEVVKTSRYYFLDNGVRNALINNFNTLKMRNDIGQLWENYLVMERIKYQHYTRLYANNYFWRTYDQKEVDWVEERGGQLYGYEIKWKGSGKKSSKRLFEQAYSKERAHVEVITRNNFESFVGVER